MRAGLVELGLGEVKVLCCFQLTCGEALGHLLGLAVSAQSSLHVVTKAVLGTSEPRLLQESSTQAQEVAELSFGSFVIKTCLFFTVSFSYPYPFSKVTRQLQSGQWHVNEQHEGHSKREFPTGCLHPQQQWLARLWMTECNKMETALPLMHNKWKTCGKYLWKLSSTKSGWVSTALFSLPFSSLSSSLELSLWCLCPSLSYLLLQLLYIKK